VLHRNLDSRTVLGRTVMLYVRWYQQMAGTSCKWQLVVGSSSRVVLSSELYTDTSLTLAVTQGTGLSHSNQCAGMFVRGTTSRLQQSVAA
jgi:hypothetical protein